MVLTPTAPSSNGIGVHKERSEHAGFDRAGKGRQRIFLYDLLVVLILGLLALIYWTVPGVRAALVTQQLHLPLYALWFGALGGVIISLKGVYDHGELGAAQKQAADASRWENQFDLWHYGRPVSGAVAGLMTWILLRALNTTAPSLPAPTIAAAAFILGTQERRFFAFLYEVSRIIVQVPQEATRSGFHVDMIEPTEGRSGDVLLVRGQGFAPKVVVLLGGVKLIKPRVSDDQTTAAGTIPEGVGKVDVIVANSDGSARSLPGAFTYQEVTH